MKSVGTKSNGKIQTKGLVLLVAMGAVSISAQFAAAASAARTRGNAVSAAVLGSSPRAQAAPAQPSQVAQAGPVETFQGELTPEPDPGDYKGQAASYSIVDELHKGYFFLDDEQTKEPLWKYAGKRVEITGTLDAKSRTVHVESIKAIGWY
jgi:hypothetical protein